MVPFVLQCCTTLCGTNVQKRHIQYMYFWRNAGVLLQGALHPAGQEAQHGRHARHAHQQLELAAPSVLPFFHWSCWDAGTTGAAAALPLVFFLVVAKHAHDHMQWRRRLRRG